MSQEKPKNINDWNDLCRSDLTEGDRIHLNVSGQVTEDAFYLGWYQGQMGIKVRLGKVEHDLFWGDVIELWKVELKKPDAK